MDDRADLEAVLARYDPAYRPRGIVAASGGLSAGSVWRLETAAGPLCLRAWPPGTTRGRVDWIHAAVRHAAAAGCDLLPAPIATRDGAEFVWRQQQVWDLSRWLPGEADFPARPSPERLRAAVKAVASVHAALSDYRLQYPPAAERETPALAERLRLIEWFGDEEWRSQISSAPIPAAYPELGDLRSAWLARFTPAAPALAARLRAALGSVPIQCCLCDLWHAHVLFTDNRVTGLVDPGAMHFDTRATDLARLLGSLVGGDRAGWQSALAAYREVHPFTPAEESLAYLLDEANILLTPAIWLSWLLGENRGFSNTDLVRERLRIARERLR